ncbi:hypothetical protein [Paenibacillus farraposensis]|uniref:hypothetical protein n=1 Tax=Paenibacillus farraposensis TaxID=2807095 RepID=UPI001E48FB7A|nr:hypothetical protein [Paenibacillus farraposensis]MCC3378393.1 hypothetical protein [Paenibacillus farraposensis]
MSQHDREKGWIEVKTQDIRSFEGGSLIVNDVPAIRYEHDNDEQIAIGDVALMAGYAQMLEKSNVIGEVSVLFEALKQKFTVEDFLGKSKVN